MRATTKIIIGTITGILLMTVLFIGILSRSRFVEKKTSSYEGDPGMSVLDVSKFRVIRFKPGETNSTPPGQLMIMDGSASQQAGMLSYRREIKKYMKQEVSRDTLTISLMPIGKSEEENKETKAVSLILFAGSNVNVINECPLEISVVDLQADSLTLTSTSAVSLSGCKVDYSRIETTGEKGYKK